MQIKAKFRGKKQDIESFIKAIEDSDLAEAIATSDFVNRDEESFDLYLTFSSTEKNQMYWEIKAVTTAALIYAVEDLAKVLDRDFKETLPAYINTAKIFMESKEPHEIMQFVSEKLGVLYEPPAN